MIEYTKVIYDLVDEPEMGLTIGKIYDAEVIRNPFGDFYTLKYIIVCDPGIRVSN